MTTGQTFVELNTYPSRWLGDTSTMKEIKSAVGIWPSKDKEIFSFGLGESACFNQGLSRSIFFSGVLEILFRQVCCPLRY